jgi:signal transduction histidine kinase
MRPRTVWQALPRPGYLLSPWPWRSAAYLLTGVLSGAGALVVVAGGAVAGAGLALVAVGVPVLLLTVLAGAPVARLERRRLRLLGPAPPPGRLPAGDGVRARLRDGATWREFGHAVLLGCVLWPLDALAVTLALAVPLSLLAAPLLLAASSAHETKVLKAWTLTTWPAAGAAALLGLAALAAGGYLLGVAAGARAGLARLLLTPRDADLGAKVVELTRSRARLVDAFEAERRRIERDLHDGAQQRLVALTMTLGLARLDAPPGPLADQLAAAHDQASAVLAELRELIRGVHPKVLADFGLEAAVTDVADRSPVPVDVALDLPARLPDAVEAAAYFVVCEALANVARHSGATRAEVSGGHRDGRLRVRVRDDGRGGADAAAGSGLTGLADRVSVLDGRLSLSSPPGGPTDLTAEFPCHPREPTDRCA